MSTQITIVCDSDVDETPFQRTALCHQTYATDMNSTDAVRAYAAKDGWIFSDGDYDICPACKRKPTREEVP